MVIGGATAGAGNVILGKQDRRHQVGGQLEVHDHLGQLHRPQCGGQFSGGQCQQRHHHRGYLDQQPRSADRRRRSATSSPATPTRAIAILTSGNVIKGNYIGLDATGKFAVGNRVGIGVDNGAIGTVIGGRPPGSATSSRETASTASS
jgi:hypothetical protein